jgi:tetratricopeptide (TPR) repeat protein
VAHENWAPFQSNVATTLDNLAVLYRITLRLTEAELAYQEALKIRRLLAQENPAAYRPDLMATLNNLALLYRDTQRFEEAEEVDREAQHFDRPE